MDHSNEVRCVPLHICFLTIDIFPEREPDTNANSSLRLYENFYKLNSVIQFKIKITLFVEAT